MRLQLILAGPLLCLLLGGAGEPGSQPVVPPAGELTAAAADPDAATEPPPATPASAAPTAAGPKPVSATIDVRTGLYQDSDHTTISTSTVAARALVKERVQLTARYLVDVVSSASVDVVTAATTTIHDIRHEATLGAGYRGGTYTADLGYIYSRENDWESHTIELGGSRDLLQHNLTVGLGGTLVFNDVGRSGDSNFHRGMNVYGAALSLGGTPSRRDALALTYSFTYLAGYQASPYRYVTFTDAQGLRESLPEVVPDTRQRHALAVRWKRHVLQNSAIALHARGYVDDWQVVSLTTGFEYSAAIGNFVISPHLRAYVQNHAGFYQAQYAQRVNFMTADRELSTFVDAFAGLRTRWARRHLGPLEELRLELNVSGFGFYFFDFPRLQSRYGLVAELALGVTL